MPRIVIGLSGTPSSGKDTVANYLVRKGFAHYSLSAILREIMEEKGVRIKQPELTDFGNALEKNYGVGHLAKIAIKKIDPGSKVVISSIRQPGEIEVLRGLTRFFMIFVDAPIEERFARLKGRRRSDDHKTIDAFKEMERVQMNGLSGGINLRKCQEMSDYQIFNDGDLDDLNQKTGMILKEIMKNIE